MICQECGERLVEDKRGTITVDIETTYEADELSAYHKITNRQARAVIYASRVELVLRLDDKCAEIVGLAEGQIGRKIPYRND